MSSYFWFTASEGWREERRGVERKEEEEEEEAVGWREGVPERFNDYGGGKWVVWWIRGVIPVPKVSLQLDSAANCYGLNR